MILTPEEQEYDKRIKDYSLHLKFDEQLTARRESYLNKIPRVFEDVDKFVRYPDAIRYELEQQLKEEFKGAALAPAIEEEFISQRDFYLSKTAKLNEIVELIDKEIEFRNEGKVTRTPTGTTYYVDFDNGHDVNNDGSSATKTNGDGPWATLDKFTGLAGAGDICIVRGSMTQTVSSDLAFVGDGTIDNPIIIKRDYGDEWSDHANISGTATATLVFGSKTVTYSADISGVLAAGNWIYVDGEDNKEFAYEVASVVTTTVTLYLPYKGNQAGSGKTTHNMGDNPIWNTVAGSFQWNFDADDYWKVQGVHIRGADSNGRVEIDGADGHIFKDCIFEGDGARYGIHNTDDAFIGEVLKCRFYNNQHGIRDAFGASGLRCKVKDCLFDGNNSGGNGAFLIYGFSKFTVEESESKNMAQGDLILAENSSFMQGRNFNLTSATKVDLGDTLADKQVLLEDYGNTLNDTRQFTSRSSAEDVPIIQSETSTVRSGGSTIAIKVIPSTELSINWEFSKIKLFELPIYATTDSKTYDIYFRPTATADWTADPTNSELWIELEAWGHASNNFRQITKSTGTIDMNGSTSWAALSITVAPAQVGVAYLKCYYAKTKEGGKANTFFCDPIPEIS